MSELLAAQPRARRQALSDRDAQALCLSGGLPGADAGRRSPGRHLAARRQELRLDLHHSAGLHLLPALLNRHRAGQAELDLRLLCGVVGQPALCRGRPLSAVADGLGRPRSERDHRLGLASSTSRNPPLQPSPTPHRCNALLDRLQPRAQRAAKARNVFPRILDEYVVREFLGTFLLVLAGFVMLMLVFTFFELIGDILRNHIALSTDRRISAQPHARACSTRSRRWRC